MQAIKHTSKEIHLGFENPGQASPKVQNDVISGPTKRTDVLQKFVSILFRN